MAVRDEHCMTIKCPSCENEGQADVSENEVIWDNRVGFRVDRLPPKFSRVETISRGSWGDAVKARCEDCGEVFTFPSVDHAP